MSKVILPMGKNIKKLRKQLADISFNMVIKLESGGITNPLIDALQKLAKALNVLLMIY